MILTKLIGKNRHGKEGENMTTRRRFVAGVLAVPMVQRFGHAQGADPSHYPDRPVRLILPFSAGGQSDTIARTMQPRISEALGQQLVIENRTGAAGSIGAGIVAASAPDGYNLLFDAASFLIVPLAMKSLPFDYETAFAPIGIVAEQPYVLAVTTDSPVRDVAGFLAAAKAARQPLTYGTPGVGSVGHLAGALLATRAGIQLEHVPYRGGADVARDMAAGSIYAGIISFNSLGPLLQSGKARVIAVTSGIRRGDRSVPTIAESGFPGFDLTSWSGVFARAGTPAVVIQKIVAAFNHATSDNVVKERLAAIGSEATTADPDGFATRLVSERQVVQNIVRQTGITFQ
jgi:tripartite-type tricarboxylate transporter receptor subunit TctC